MKLKTIALAALSLAFTFATAQTLEISTGQPFKSTKRSAYTRIADTDKKGNLVTAYASGSDFGMEELSVVTTNENLKSTTTVFDIEKKTDKALKFGGIGLFNNKVILYGNYKNGKEWPYSVIATDYDGNVTSANEIKIKSDFNIQLGNASVFFTKGFSKSPNNKYGAVYTMYSSKKNSTIISIAVFDNDMNIVSNAMITVPGYTGSGYMTKVLIDDDGNAIGAVKETPENILNFKGKYSPNLYSVILKKGADDINLVKLPTTASTYVTLDIEAIGNNKYGVYGIYKKSQSGADIDGANAFIVDIDGKADATGDITGADKFNIFSKGKLELISGEFKYRILPSVKTKDGAVFIVQKQQTSASNMNGSEPLRHYMDVYLVKLTSKGIEWDIRIPAFTSNAPSFQLSYNEANDILYLVYHANEGMKFASEDDLTPRESNNSAKGAYYVVAIDGEGKITAADETKEKYDNAKCGYVVGNTIYEYITIPGFTFQEKIRKVVIE